MRDWAIASHRRMAYVHGFAGSGGTSARGTAWGWSAWWWPGRYRPRVLPRTGAGQGGDEGTGCPPSLVPQADADPNADGCDLPGGRTGAANAGGQRTNLSAVALGLAAMVLLPAIVFSLIPSGLAGTVTGSSDSPVTASQSRFGPVVIQAASPANRLSGYARVDTYPGAPGGTIVRGIGNYGGSRPLGTLTVPVTVPATGSYTLAFSYVHINGQSTRIVDIMVDRASTVTVRVTGSARCCASESVTVALGAGANTITFANPLGLAPSINRIVIASQ